MGYRSNGCMVIYGSEEDMKAFLMIAKMGQTDPAPWGPIKDSHVRIYKNGKYVVWHLEYEGWKWYTDYPEVAEYERIYNLAQENEDLQGYKVRIGEDYSDIEVSAFNDADYPDIIRSYDHAFRDLYGDNSNCPDLRDADR